jgi:methylated-DNA-[protein]-cysteine S-methyltransferase
MLKREGMMYCFSFETEVGEMGFVWRLDSDKKIRVIRILLSGDMSASVKVKKVLPNVVFKSDERLKDASRKIQGYLRGEEVSLPLELVDWDILSEFQKKVFRVQLSVPKGKVNSYAWLAEKVGVKAFRAVGRALGSNPFPILLPCHRTVRKSGEIGGFTSGARVKEHLLKLEGVEFDSRGRVKKEYFVE